MSKFNHPSTLCWDCQNAVGKCSWSDKFIPVKGWTAARTYTQTGKPYSYYVTECPEFIRDIPRGGKHERKAISENSVQTTG